MNELLEIFNKENLFNFWLYGIYFFLIIIMCVIVVNNIIFSKLTRNEKIEYINFITKVKLVLNRKENRNKLLLRFLLFIIMPMFSAYLYFLCFITLLKYSNLYGMIRAKENFERFHIVPIVKYNIVKMYK